MTDQNYWQPRNEPYGQPAAPVPAQPYPAYVQPPIQPPAKKRHVGLIVAGVCAAFVAAAVCMALFLTLTGVAPWTDQQQARHACEDAVKAQLKSPATAKFSDETISRTPIGGGWDVVGSVDSQNGFGALVRGSWTCHADKQGSGWQIRGHVS
jgi:hypothetical protein